MDNGPVSVVIPAYNTASPVSDDVDSIFKQTYRRLAKFASMAKPKSIGYRPQIPLRERVRRLVDLQRQVIDGEAKVGTKVKKTFQIHNTSHLGRCLSARNLETHMFEGDRLL